MKLPSLGLQVDKLTTALLFSVSSKSIGVSDCIRMLSIDVSSSTDSEYEASSLCNIILQIRFAFESVSLSRKLNILGWFIVFNF